MTSAKEPGSVAVRPAVPEDAAAIAELSSELGYPTATEPLALRLRRMASEPGHRVLVAERRTDGVSSCVGWIHGFEALRVEGEPFVEIGGLVVSRLARRSGVGTSLISEIGEWARGAGIDTLRVRCRDERQGAHRFYRELGFAEIKLQRIFERRP